MATIARCAVLSQSSNTDRLLSAADVTTAPDLRPDEIDHDDDICDASSPLSSDSARHGRPGDLALIRPYANHPLTEQSTDVAADDVSGSNSGRSPRVPLPTATSPTTNQNTSSVEQTQQPLTQSTSRDAAPAAAASARRQQGTHAAAVTSSNHVVNTSTTIAATATPQAAAVTAGDAASPPCRHTAVATDDDKSQPLQTTAAAVEALQLHRNGFSVTSHDRADDVIRP